MGNLLEYRLALPTFLWNWLFNNIQNLQKETNVVSIFVLDLSWFTSNWTQIVLFSFFTIFLFIILVYMNWRQWQD